MSYTSKLTLFLLWITSLGITYGQKPSEYTLEQCFDLATQNYPQVQKLGLIEKSAAYEIAQANSNYLPVVNFSAQATYQSQTINFSQAMPFLPDASMLPVLSKDQYKISAQVSQLIYDGGATANQKQLAQLNSSLQSQSVTSMLYAIKLRVSNLFFGIILTQEQTSQNLLNINTLEGQLEKTKAWYSQGVAYKSNIDELQSAILQLKIQNTQLRNNALAYKDMLSLFINRPIDGELLLTPLSNSWDLSPINRPEIKEFELLSSIYQTQEKQLKSAFYPRLSAFFQGAYARPTLNIIDNTFGDYYIAGITLNWNISALYSFKNKRKSLELQQQIVEQDKQTFLFNTNLDIIAQQRAIENFMELIHLDQHNIVLREDILHAAKAQVEHGVSTMHEFIEKNNALLIAQQNQILHQVQLQQALFHLHYLTNN